MMKSINGLLAVGLLGITHQASAISINFDYSFDNQGFFNDAGRRSVLENAGAFFERSLQDNLTAINSSGSNQFSATFRRPDNGAAETISNFSVAANTITVYAGGRNLGGSLGVGGPGGFSASGSQAFFDSSRSRGQGNGTTADVSGSTATEFGPWGGSIAFNTTSNWFFDDDVNTDESFAGQNDFFSVALHELGHLLGFGTSDSWRNLIINGEFTGAASTSEHGGNVDLASDLAHWASGTSSDGQEAALDPNITVGTRKRFTDLDLAALKDIGWEVDVTAIPVPPSVLLFGSGLLGLIGFRRKSA